MLVPGAACKASALHDIVWSLHADRGQGPGVLVSIASDAHRVLELDNLRYGIGQARRGWLSAGDVLNTRMLDELWPLLDATMGRSVRRGQVLTPAVAPQPAPFTSTAVT